MGILLADHELANDPLHLTVRAGKRAVGAQTLFATAHRVPGFFKGASTNTSSGGRERKARY